MTPQDQQKERKTVGDDFHLTAVVGTKTWSAESNGPTPTEAAKGAPIEQNEATDNEAAVCGNSNEGSTSVVVSYLELAVVPQKEKKLVGQISQGIDILAAAVFDGEGGSMSVKGGRDRTRQNYT